MTDEQRTAYQDEYDRLEKQIEATSDPKLSKTLQEAQARVAAAMQQDNAATESVVSQS